MSTNTAMIPAPSNGGAINAFHSEGSFESAQRMARALASSSLVPQSYRGNLADCLIAIELANRTGASVPMVMQNLDIIHGRPSWRSTFLIATVNACGRFSPLRYRWEGEQGKDSWGCRAVAKDRADGEECVGPLITIAIAKSEGWYSRNGSKWKTLPELMLTYRAAAFWTRIYAPELSLGMLTSEEAEVLPMASASGVSAASALNQRLQLAPVVSAEAPEPEWTPGDDFPIPEPEVPEERAPEPEGNPKGRYFAMLSERGITGDTDRRAFQKRLHAAGLVASASVTAWTADDFAAACAELEAIPVAEEGGEG